MHASRIIIALLVLSVGATAQTAEAVKGSAPPEANPTATLTAAPNAYPDGTYTSPWCGNGCDGPVGGSGPLTYEIYAITGPSLVVGGSELSSALKTGIQVGGGARSLYFNQSQSAAWVFELGLIYTYNRGQGDKTLNVATPRTAPITIDPLTGQQTGGQRIFPDGLANYQVRGLNRTDFCFGVGRDWWLWGPGSVQGETGPNLRVGSDVGGRWGTASIDLVPRQDPDNYLSRTGITHSVVIGMHANYERPVGAWILTAGVRAEWAYTITNIVPPLGGDIHNINLLFTLGARF